MKVCKFGGSSLAGPEQIRQICRIVTADPERRLIIVSAPGKRDAADTKVTDLLIACAEAVIAGGTGREEMDRIIDRYRAIQEGLELDGDVLDAIAANLNARLVFDAEHKGRFMDAMKAAGEDNCARLVAAELRRQGVAASYMDPGEAGLLLTDEYGNAQLLPESYENLSDLRERDGITVFPGFFGATLEGHVVTFPRGGSDISGSILAAAVDADLYENFTDVDSVFSADPRVVPNATPITELTYREMRELSYAGFGVFHDEAILPVIQAGIPICIRNTHRPEAPGTLIVPERDHAVRGAVGIAGSDGFCTLCVSKYLMNREIGFGRRFLQIFEEEGLSYEHVPSGIDSLSIILSEGDLDPDTEARVQARLQDELGVTDITVERGLALVMVVGEGMRFTVGLAARATAALSASDINIEMMNQGASEISMMFGVKAGERERAVRALYGAFFED